MYTPAKFSFLQAIPILFFLTLRLHFRATPLRQASGAAGTSDGVAQQHRRTAGRDWARRVQVATIDDVELWSVVDVDADDMAPLGHVAVVRVLAEQWGEHEAVRLALECDQESADAEAS